MKIVIISAAYPLRGGIAHSAGLLYKELSIGHEVKLITFKRQYPKFLFPGKSQTESTETIDKIPSEVILDSINPFNWSKTAEHILEFKPELVIFKHWLPFFAPCYGWIAKKIKNKSSAKMIAVCHNIIPHEKRLGDKLLSKYFLKSIDYFIPLSDQVTKDLHLFIEKPVYKLLPLPVFSLFGDKVNKQEAKEFLKLDDEKILLFFGFIRDYKGLDILIEAFSIVRKKMDIRLIVAGEFYESEEKYLNLISKHQLENSILLKKDFILTSDVKYYFSASDAVVLPYKSATQSGIVQVAVNFAMPVIAANVGGIGEVIEDGKTGFVVEKENPEKLADAIIRFYKEEKENEFSSNMNSLKEKYSWKNFVKGMFELIN
ncbi:MAG: glycosyltransferase [Ignavibacteriales bacterium]|nr:MAG: glycosyltransferase [Ignavibacteriales bacterium]